LTAADVVVLLTAGRRMPRSLRKLTKITADQVTECRRVVVVGSHADLAAVLTKLLRADRLDVELAHVRRPWHARRARAGVATRIPLVRDDTGAVVTSAAYWLPPDENTATVRGEATVDDTVLFHGDVTGVRIEPIATMPGLRATALSSRMRPKRWVAGRAAQLGTVAALVVRDGVPAQRPIRRSTFYRHTEGWLSVR
jgi:hypothetical protein